MSGNGETYLSGGEVADLLDEGRSTVRRKTMAGEIPFAFKGNGRTGAYFYRPADIAPLVLERADYFAERAKRVKEMVG